MATRLSPALATKILGDNINLVSNGTFDSVTTGWTAVTAALTSEADGQAGNCLRVAESGGVAAGSAYQDVVTKVGHLYSFSGYFKKGTADSGMIKIGTSGSPTLYYTSGALSDAAWAQKKAWFIATTVATRITLESTDATAGEYSDFDTLVLTCESHSLQDIMNGAEIKVYSGTQPATANLAPTGTLLCTIKNAGSGITLGDAVAGVIGIAAGETWNGVTGVAGTAAWFRMQHDDDLETLNDTDCRLDGSVGTTGAQLNFTSTTFALGATETVTGFNITFPTA